MTQKTNLVYQGKAKDFSTFIQDLKDNGINTIGELMGVEKSTRQAINEWHAEEARMGLI